MTSIPQMTLTCFILVEGFPELFAEQLAANQTMLEGVRSVVQRGVPVYAECGGYMYLGRECLDASGHNHSLVGVLPYTFRMGTERAQLGYREIVTVRETLIGPVGTCVRGHEFYWSHQVEPLSRDHVAYEREGYADTTILASYIHVLFAANPQVMANLFHNCLLHREARKAGESYK